MSSRAANVRTITESGLQSVARDAIEIDEMYATDVALVGGIGTLKKRLDELERRAVTKAVEQGATWAEIGTALGISRQAAHERFSS